MIFYHTRYVLEKQDRKGQNGDIDDSDDDVDVDSGSGGDDDDDTYDWSINVLNVLGINSELAWNELGMS